MATLDVIIGAGFSFYAGHPLGNAVKLKFDRSLTELLLRQGSSEWQWKEGKQEAVIHNGLNPDSRQFAFILEAIVEGLPILGQG